MIPGRFLIFVYANGSLETNSENKPDHFLTIHYVCLSVEGEIHWLILLDHPPSLNDQQISRTSKLRGATFWIMLEILSPIPDHFLTIQKLRFFWSLISDPATCVRIRKRILRDNILNAKITNISEAADIVFVVDSSRNVGNEQSFNSIRNFMLEVVRQVSHASGGDSSVHSLGPSRPDSIDNDSNAFGNNTKRRSSTSQESRSFHP